MANKNFIVRHGLETNNNVLVANTDTNSVGIGTATPTSSLHVIGTANITTSLTVAGTDIVPKISAVGTSGNVYATAVGTSGNAYAVTVGTSGNTYATSVGTSGNTYATAVGTSGNTYATSVGTSGNTYATSVGTSGNTYATAVGAASNAAMVGQQTIWVPAGAMTPRTTLGAASGSLQVTTANVMLSYLAFDSSTKEGAQFGIQMPKGWDEGSLYAQFVWTHPTAASNFGVSWELAAVAFADGNAANTAFGTLQEIDDTGGTANTIYITSETPAITVDGSPGAEEYVMYQVTRDYADTGDTLAVDAYLLGVKIHYTTDAAKDD